MTVYERTGSIVGSTEYYVLLTNGDQVKEACEWPAAPTREQIKALVEKVLRGYAEHIVVWHQNASRSMFVDMDAVAKRLPINKIATTVYRAWTIQQYPEVKPVSLGVIRGPALLFGSQVMTGEL